MTLFNGFRYLNNRKALDFTISQQELSVQSKQNDLQIRVIETYIELCKQTIQLELATVRIEKYNQIQAIQLLLIKGGKIASIDTLKSRNSLLNEELLLTKLVSEKRLKNLQLNFLIGVPLSTDHTFVLSSVSVITTIPQFAESIELERLAIEAQLNENQLKTDRASILPTLSLNGNIGTGFSTNNKDYTQVGNPTKSYNDQITQNLYEGIGFYLSVPLFNHGDWFKTKELNRVKVNELAQSKQLVELNLEMKKMEREQQLVTKKAELIQVEQIGKNLQLIYDKTVLLYNEGRTTYTEVDKSFLEWQMILVEIESMKLDLEKLKLYKAENTLE
jgi:outer membrane protein